MKIQQAPLPTTNRPKPVLFGTDWHTDCDDAVAVRVLA